MSNIVYGFDRDAFLAYLEEEFRCFAGAYGNCPRGMVDNLIDYALREIDVEDCTDKIPEFLSGIIPDVTFGEVAMFINDGNLSENGRKLKQEALMRRNMETCAWTTT